MYQQVRQHGRDPAEQPLLRPLRHQTHEETPGRAEEPATDPEETSERDRRWCRPPLKAIRFRATTKGKSCLRVLRLPVLLLPLLLLLLRRRLLLLLLLLFLL